MASITVNGHRVEVDDQFFKLSRKEQDATVEEMARQINSQLEKALASFKVDSSAMREARRAGYSDDEIVDHLSKTAPGPIKKAKDAGFSSKEILDFVSGETATSVSKPVQQASIEITTADKINGIIGVFAQPQFYVHLAVVMILLAVLGRAKRTAQAVPTRLGRLGVVLHWASLFVAAILLVCAGLILSQMKDGDSFMLTISGAFGAAALVVWLIGKAFRYILTGPAEAPSAPQASASRTTSVPPSGGPRMGPWGTA
jgi:hypothetical protein